jgi:arylformamidase
MTPSPGAGREPGDSTEIVMSKLYDVSLPISEQLVTYPGDPGIELRPHSRISAGDDANITTLRFGSHTGTHMDAPHHFVDGGATIDEIPLDVLIGPAVVARIADDVRMIGRAELEAIDVRSAPRLLLRTRGSELLSHPGFRNDFPYLNADGARYLVEAGARLVGIDYLSIEEFDAEEPVAHRILLGAGVVILEGVDLRQVPPGPYELICLPLRLAGGDGAPARVVLRG